MSSVRMWSRLLGSLMFVVVTWLCFAATAPVLAQTSSCNAAINALQDAVSRCSEINSNWACYGISTTTALPIGLRFTRPGDRQPVSSLDSITTVHPGGAAFMRLVVVGEPDPVTIVLFGGSELSPVKENVFLLRYENGDPICANTPPGMVVRTENGRRGRITVNGVDIQLESTAFIAMQSEALMTIVNVGGQVTIAAPSLGVLQPLPAAQQVAVTQSNGVPSAVGQPEPSPIAQSALLQWLAEDSAALSRVVDHNTEPSQTIPACGGTIAVGQTIEAQNAVPGQECLYTFQGTAGDVVTVAAVATGGGVDPWVDLRGPAGDLSGFNNDLDEGEQDSQLCNHGLAVSGQYTIVVRPYHNENAGSFRLTLNGETACLPPPPQCELVSSEAALRSGPDYNFQPPVQLLTAGARFEPLAQVAGGRWLQIALLPDGERGWISVNPYEALCDIDLAELPVVAPPPPPPITPTPTFTPTPLPLCYKVQPPNWCAYRVRPGDNLTNIAGRTGADLGVLREVNCKVYSDIIRIDEILYVPCPPPTWTPIPPPTVAPAVTPTATITPTVAPCEPLAITSLGVTSGEFIAWEATGGCDPVSGALTINFTVVDYYSGIRRTNSTSAKVYAVAGRSGRQEMEFPDLGAFEVCSLQVNYTLALSDGSGQRVEQRDSTVLSERDCPSYSPLGTQDAGATGALTPTRTVNP